ncbi:hypothetical protein G647_02337 [Cladophialophora carrionii CBS 160.54]|uniref:Major facilitator superfamily (MFS) profile domain-containing protein n=1 Tax=Cladophialophora carrionii CBS 160.54 TaxID=1279043 RepID=V9DGW1_9EURO|nr:uncharacterized protein G647_02337 [Cladophialophora carrionii CBS 160.54]ETI25563.1 hypothetical protein G647_02337 [Cladophialophora carrionii CBS 160.54]
MVTSQAVIVEDENLTDNPLRGLTDIAVKADASTFHRNHDLHEIVDVETFVRGALAAKDPDEEAYDSIEGLTPIERQALIRENARGVLRQLRRLSKDFHVVLATCCLAAITQGWDQSSINGANLGWPREFGLNANLADPLAHSHDVWIFGIVNASTYISAAFIGCWLSDPLNEHIYGRRGALFVAGLFSFSTVIGAAYAQSWQALLACRVVLGFGMGAKASVVPILLAESAPRSIRGTLVICWQLFDAFGIFLGNAANLAVFDKWRRMVAAPFIPALLMLLLIPVCTESPRWLLKKGRYQAALLAWMRLHGSPTPILACRDLYFTNVQIQHETIYISRGLHNRAMPLQPANDAVGAHDTYQNEVSLTSYWTRFLQLFKVARIRRAGMAAFVVMIAQQACGVNILAFLSSTIFNDAILGGRRDPSTGSALWMSFGFGLANFLFTAFALISIDSKGRRFLLNLSFPNMAWTLLAAGLCFLIPDGDTRVGLIVFFVLLFTLAYSAGEGPVAFIISSEVFPLVNREVGMSFAVFWNLLGAGILALTAPILAYALTHTGLLALFAGLNLVCWAAVFFLVPETTRIGLEDLNKIFEIRTLMHIKYRIEILKWVFRRRENEPRPFHIWAEEQEQQQLGG